LARSQHAAFRVGEAGVVGAGEFLERAFKGVEARGRLLGRGAERRCALGGSWRLGGARVSEESLVRRAIRDGAVAGEESNRLAGGERVAADDLGEFDLLALAEGREPERRRKRERAVVELEAEFRGELAGESEAALDPSSLLPEEFSDGSDRKAVVVGERGGDVGFVHGTDGARGSVRRQKPRLHGDAGGPFDDDGDLTPPLGDPDDEALEAVDHLIDAVAGGRDANGEWRQEHPLVAALAAKAPERGPDPVDGDVLDEAHRISSSGRSWKSG